MKSNKALKTLNLSGNDLGNDVGTVILDELFIINSTLQMLEIRWNSFKDSIMKRFKEFSVDTSSGGTTRGSKSQSVKGPPPPGMKSKNGRSVRI